MRYAIIADIHSNLAAFTAVLDDIERRGGAEEVWCLGDVVGYGPEPHQCLELLRQRNHVCVAGNLAVVASIALLIVLADKTWQIQALLIFVLIVSFIWNKNES